MSTLVASLLTVMAAAVIRIGIRRRRREAGLPAVVPVSSAQPQLRCPVCGSRHRFDKPSPPNP
jgi:hypothetical protein